MPDIEQRLQKIDVRLDTINRELGELVGAQKSANTLIKYVILPLIVILGGLVGIKII